MLISLTLNALNGTGPILRICCQVGLYSYYVLSVSRSNLFVPLFATDNLFKKNTY